MAAYSNMTPSVVIRQYYQFALIVRTVNIKPTHYEATPRQHNIKKIQRIFIQKGENH